MSWLNAIKQYLTDHPDAGEVYLTDRIREELNAEQGGEIYDIGMRLPNNSARFIPLVSVYTLAARHRVTCFEAYPVRRPRGIPYPRALDRMPNPNVQTCRIQGRAGSPSPHTP